MDSLHNEEFDFNQLPAEVKNRILASHLKTTLQMVEDLNDDNTILQSRLYMRLRELEKVTAKLEHRDETLNHYRAFLSRVGLERAFFEFSVKRTKAKAHAN